MMSNQLALIQREVWEHRSIWLTPAAIGIVVVLMTATGLIMGSGFQGAADLAILGASNVGDAERRAVLTAALSGVTVIFTITMWILSIFYCLDSLYAERKDKSILFWRSLPVTDTETVVSKLLVAAVVIPVVTFGAVIVTHLVNLIVTSIWVSAEGGSPGHLLWDFGALFDNWAATLIFLLAVPMWLSPFIGWFLFVSAFTKRTPLLFAFLPVFVLPMLERLIFGSSLLADAIFVRTGNMPLFGNGVDIDAIFEHDHVQLTNDMVSVLGIIDLGKFFSSPSLWAGLIVCALLTTAAVYVRRYRDES